MLLLIREVEFSPGVNSVGTPRSSQDKPPCHNRIRALLDAGWAGPWLPPGIAFGRRLAAQRRARKGQNEK